MPFIGCRHIFARAASASPPPFTDSTTATTAPACTAGPAPSRTRPRTRPRSSRVRCSPPHASGRRQRHPACSFAGHQRHRIRRCGRAAGRPSRLGSPSRRPQRPPQHFRPRTQICAVGHLCQNGSAVGPTVRGLTFADEYAGEECDDRLQECDDTCDCDCHAEEPEGTLALVRKAGAMLACNCPRNNTPRKPRIG